MVNRGRIAGSVLSPLWRVWLVGFVIAVVGLTAVSNAWHAEHDAHSGCFVCEFENEPLAELGGDLQVGPCDTLELVSSLCVTTLALAHLDAQGPARAPPLS